MGNVTDEQLLTLVKSGKEDAFAQLVRRYEKELYNFLVKFTGQASLAEEAFQEAFLQVHLSIEAFDTSRRFRPWLYTIASNKARDLLRKKSRRPSINLSGLDNDENDFDLLDALLTDDTTPQDIYSQKELCQQVREIVAQLSDNLREILVLAYFKQLSYREMAEALDIPLGTVKSRLHSAVATFAVKYKELTEK
ncbi:MAG: sigma-70 family RNA polymerase sigma factor [Phycisphaerae bacterium]|nr:sigma-70 family RNA polymerase sigma factor [Phycisphaerae bacterium]